MMALRNASLGACGRIPHKRGPASRSTESPRLLGLRQALGLTCSAYR